MKGTQVAVAHKMLMDIMNYPIAKSIFFQLKQNLKALKSANDKIEDKREILFKWLKRLDTGAFDPEDADVQNAETALTKRLEETKFDVQLSKLPIPSMLSLSVFHIMLMKDLWWDLLDTSSLWADIETKTVTITHENMAMVSYYFDYLAKIPWTQMSYSSLSFSINSIEKVWWPIAKEYKAEYDANEDKAAAAEIYNNKLKANDITIELAVYTIPESDYINAQQIFVLQEALGEDLIIFWEGE